jgi:hypothetical protein
MKNSQVAKERRRTRKIIGEAIKKDIEINEFDKNMIYDNIL